MKTKSASGTKEAFDAHTDACLTREFILEKIAALTLQRWGRSLAVRIPSSAAGSVGFKVGQPVEVSTQDSAVVVSAAVAPRLTLKQKLIRFDPERHGGEPWLQFAPGSYGDAKRH